MSLYELLKFLHVLAAAIWVGGASAPPTSRRASCWRSGGRGDAEVNARLQRISTLSWIDLGLLVLAVFVIVVKSD